MKLSLLLALSLAPVFAQTPTPAPAKPEPPKAETAPAIPDKLIANYFKADSIVKQAQIALQSTQQYIDLQAAQKAQGDTVTPMRDVCGAKFDLALAPDKMTPVCQPKPAQPSPMATTPAPPPADTKP